MDQLLESLNLLELSEWEKAHSIAQDIPTNYGALIHGLIHEMEGDQWNADYWYNSAGLKPKGNNHFEKISFIKNLILNLSK